MCAVTEDDRRALVLTAGWVAVVFAIRAQHARRVAGQGKGPADDAPSVEPPTPAAPATLRAS